MPAAVYPSSAQRPAARTDEILEKAIRAMGGLERIHAIHSLVFRGFHYEGSYKQEFAGSRASDALMVRMRPGLRLVGCRPEIPDCDGKWSDIVEAFDGEHGWELNWPKQRLVRTVNKAERALRCGAEFDSLFIDYKKRGFAASYLGRKVVLGREAEAVQVDQDGCSSAIYYFDPKTFELRMTELAIPVHARGDAVRMVAVHKEFRTVNGVRLPSRSEEINLATGEVLAGGEWTSIAANTLDAAKIFSPPAVNPTGITAVVVKMLAKSKASSPKEMMSDYLIFRATEDGGQADVVYDMNWLGYELLKVDKYDDAIAVFGQVIAENPSSAEAYDNLGEAYLQKGEKKNAISAFEHAVDLGLKDPDVGRKLSELCKEEECSQASCIEE
jgi:tetratricopeptide (TPR) repeat protein